MFDVRPILIAIIVAILVVHPILIAIIIAILVSPFDVGPFIAGHR
jgi:hypothetical protein